MPDAAQDRGERRLDAWRRSIALFDRTTREQGPFHRAGYTNFVLEPKTEDGRTPDIIGAARDRFVVCDISISPTKETDGLRHYRGSTLTHFLRMRLGTSTEPRMLAAPFYLTPERRLRDFPQDLNAIQLVSPFDRHLGDISDDSLRNALGTWPGFAGPPPNYSLLAVPESELTELKFSVAGVLRQHLATGESAVPDNIAKILLGDRAPDFPPKAIRVLSDKVAALLEQASAHLGEYARWDKMTRMLAFTNAETIATNATSRVAVANRIAAWLGTPFIEQFERSNVDGDEDEDDDE